MREIFVGLTFTATADDLFAGTELETFPGRGAIIVRAASTVLTATILAGIAGGQQVSQARIIPLRAGPLVSSSDRAFVLRGEGGDRTKVDLGGTTGTVKVEGTYVGE